MISSIYPPPPSPPASYWTPPQMELSGAGLYAKRVSDDEVELTWKTGNEKGNVGFIVSRRAAKTEGWEEIASFTDFPPLNSKGWVSFFRFFSFLLNVFSFFPFFFPSFSF